MVDRKDQKDHHLYPPGFELTVGSVKRYVEYHWVASHCKGLKVMDLGCNTGFGCAIVAEEAAAVVGVDVSKEALDIAEDSFRDHPKLSWEYVVEGDLPYDKGPFDAVILLNIIEHFPDAPEMLEKIHRILKPGGKMILTTVNRKLRIFPWQKPWNRLHHKEYDVRSLKKELAPWFPEVELVGMKTTGTFFPDLVGMAWSRKWRTGIKGPTRRFLANLKRRLTGKPLLDATHISEGQNRPSVPDTQKQVRSESDKRDFYKTVGEVKVEPMGFREIDQVDGSLHPEVKVFQKNYYIYIITKKGPFVALFFVLENTVVEAVLNIFYMENKGELVLYKDPSGDMHIDVRLEEETVWLSQKQMAALFGKSNKTISEHIGRIFEEGELIRSPRVWEYTQEGQSAEKQEDRTVRDFRTVEEKATIRKSQTVQDPATIRKSRTVQKPATIRKSQTVQKSPEMGDKLFRPPTIRKFKVIQSEGNRQIEREVEHYSLDVIISVGYRVRSLRGTQFRIWATQRLREYLTKGFALNDAYLEEGRTTRNYFEELLERVRNIRTSERNFYLKVLDIFATSADYDSGTQYARKFFAIVQNKFHFAITGMTASEIIAERCDGNLENMGLTHWSGEMITRKQAQVAKNYLKVVELKRLNLLVEQFLSYAELQILEKKVIYMVDWIQKLDQFLRFNEKEVLNDSGLVSRKEMEKLVRLHLKKFNESQKLI